MDDNTLFTVAGQLNNLTSKYTSGTIKHFTYVSEYDKILENYGITKKTLIAELKKRNLLK